MAKIAKYTDLIDRICNTYAQGNEYLIDDLRNEAILALWREYNRYRFSRLRRKSNELPWVYSIVCNAMRNYMERTFSQPGIMYSDNIEKAFANCADVSDNDNDSIRHVSLYEAINKLKPDEKAVVLLVLEGYPYSEIASSLGISESAVGSRLSRIVKKLRKLMIKQQ